MKDFKNCKEISKDYYHIAISHEPDDWDKNIASYIPPTY